MSDRHLIQNAAERAKEMNDVVLRHVGTALSKEDRVKRLSETEEENRNGRYFKKRKVGARPQSAYQASDMVGCKLLHQTMK